MSLVFGEVVRKEYMTPGMVRIVFGGEGLTTFRSSAIGDEYLRFHFPVPVTGKFLLPQEDPDAPRESAMLRDIGKYLRHEVKLPGEQYKAIGYWTCKAEVWQAKYAALDERIRASLDAAWDSDRDEEEIRDEVEKTLESAGL